jgi:glycogen phosphorylase
MRTTIPSDAKYKIAYLSMEIALESDIKTYAGGLGVLAGDTLRSASDLELPMLAVTLLSDKGYFKQKINKNGEQISLDSKYNFLKLEKLPNVVKVKIKNDTVSVGVWVYYIKNKTKYPVPVYLLDTNIKTNKKEYRELTGRLYGTGREYRFMQEIVLGRGGVKILKSLGHKYIEKFHINEGHGSLSAIEIFLNSKERSNAKKLEEARRKCVFTTHTPVDAGHDKFPLDLVLKHQKDFPHKLKGLVSEDKVNMTKVGLYFSNFINGVALSHQVISSKMFPGFSIHAITNGVHSETWTSDEFKKIYDKYIPNWRNSSMSLRNVFSIPLSVLWSAHQKNKEIFFNYIYKKQKIRLKKSVFTIGFARRFTGYKRSNLLFNDVERLVKIHKNVGKIQIVYAGKAHPSDEDGKKMIKEILEIKEKYKKDIKIVFLEGYDMDLAKMMISGVDIWLNTPLPPNEASGTSGMKAAHNGVPHFSTLDGWWLEGYLRDKTGWAIGEKKGIKVIKNLNKKDADSLYDVLEKRIIPRYYKKPNKWKETMANTIAINASFFNTERMLQQYIQENYFVSES